MFINSYISIEELGFSENVESKFRIIAIQHNLINKAILMDTDSNPSSILATIYYNVLTILSSNLSYASKQKPKPSPPSLTKGVLIR